MDLNDDANAIMVPIMVPLSCLCYVHNTSLNLSRDHSHGGSVHSAPGRPVVRCSAFFVGTEH